MTINALGRELALGTLARMAGAAIVNSRNQYICAGSGALGVVTAQAIHGLVFAMSKFAFCVPRTLYAHWRNTIVQRAFVGTWQASYSVADAAGFALK